MCYKGLAPSRTIYISGEKINTILNTHPEMTLNEIKRIPEILDDPVLVLKSKNRHRGSKANTRLVMFGSIKAKNGLPVLVVLDLRLVENGLIINDMQKVTSSYTKDNKPIDFIKFSEVLHADKKRTVPFLRAIGFQMPITLKQSGSMGIISYNDNTVNIKGVPFSDAISAADTNIGKNSDRDSEADLQGKYPWLDLNQDISELDGVPAVELRDGSILPLTQRDGGYLLHVQFIEQNHISVNDLKSGGWIGHGVYEGSDRSDTARYIERQKARQEVAKLTGKPYKQFNDDFRYSERDYVPEDRELLTQAATEAEAGAEVKAYAKKVKAMERVQRRIASVREAYSMAVIGSEEKAELEKKLNELTAAVQNFMLLSSGTILRLGMSE